MAIRVSDLVLTVSPSYDPTKLQPSRYEDFLDALHGTREYAKDAVRSAVRYLVGGEYGSLRDLAQASYAANPALQARFLTFGDLERELHFPDKLACSIDLATGTGKSYVMYAIARILLSLGTVDQVLVLCPSTTIEDQLLRTFKALSADKTLRDFLPADSVVRSPRIINARQTIQTGDICIENRHAVYKGTKSAIEDSLVGKGARTLVLNDEAHHLMNEADAAFKKWKAFLLDEKFGFNRMVHLSGTCYIGDEYFTDVVHRYSLRQAIEDRVVKTIRYVDSDDSTTELERLQKIYDNHVGHRKQYRQVKPLTVLVTKDIAACKRLTEELVDFLKSKERLSAKAAADKVLQVTSAKEDHASVVRLPNVDSGADATEWITSVSMLTEGWDVKNVFQIVPHQERAFNSKLLIAQVLGRGLRIPETYAGEQPVVTIFNHAKWSVGIKHLVEEVLEIEKRLHSYPVVKPRDYNFDVHQIVYRRDEQVVEVPQESDFDLLSKGYVTFASQAEEAEKQTRYTTALTGKSDTKLTVVEQPMVSVAEAAADVVNRLKTIDMDLKTTYAKKFPRRKVEAVIRKSLQEIGDDSGMVSRSNLQRTLAAFGVVYRKASKTLRVKVVPTELTVVNTKDMRASSIAIGALRQNGTVWWDDVSTKVGDEADQRVLAEVDADESLPKKSSVHVLNPFHFKTPQNVMLTSHEPERAFVRTLVEPRNAESIDAWIKATDTGFYAIEYSWRKGEHPRQAKFNPDFFVKKGSEIIVIETKMDGDASEENKAKLRYATAHCGRLNKMQKEVTYTFKMLSPNSYSHFFDQLREGKHAEFRSELEAGLLA